MSLEPWFITGLVDGEGCFSVSFTLRRKFNTGIETRPSFSISLNQKDLPLLKSVHSYFGCGGLRYSKSDRTYKYEVRSVPDLVTYVIPHFKSYPLRGAKLQDFLRFEEICKQVRSNLHLNKTFLKEIIERAYQMNPSGKRKHELHDLLKELGEKMV